MKEHRDVAQGGERFEIYLDREGADGFRGTLYGIGAAEGVRFTSLSRMVLMIEELMDLQETLPRFRQESRNPDIELEILFRQNYSWQGRVRCGGYQTPFRSVLELMIILETAVEQ